MQKLSNAEAELKKSVTFIKKRELVNFQYNRLNGFWPRFVLKQDSEWILGWFWYCNILWKTACNLQIQRCSWEKVFWKYAENLQENTPSEVRFQ